jgi:predicted AlkP superfamily phosphohydrolase/phosphomutase
MPPQSPVAWSNFITGMDSGGHGIYDFVHRYADSYLPHFSTSDVASAAQRIRVLGIPIRNRVVVPFTDYVLPFQGGQPLNLRKGVAFWEILEAAGIGTTIFRLPANFPPVESATGLSTAMSGLGTPDILGTYGTFSFFTTDPWPGSDDVSGGSVHPVEVVDNVVRASIKGPVNEFLDYDRIADRTGSRVAYDDRKARLDFEVFIDPVHAVAKIVIGGSEAILTEGEFSDWMEIDFEMVPHMVGVNGVVRFYLKSVRPEFELHASPIQINPANQALPITEPPEYGQELVDELRHFYTQGMPEDTKALESAVFGNAEFAAQATLVLEERKRALEYHLQRFDEGLLFFYFSSLDQGTHAMWRCMDPDHPAHIPDEDEAYASFIDELYMQFDQVLARVLEDVDENTTLIILSDHGFAAWYRKVHLNRWLLDEGYLALKPGVRPEDVEWLLGVDWSKTRAYSIGINGLYLNVKGREGQGIVEPGPEADALVDEIAEKLEGVIDPENGQRAVVRAYKSREFYHGPLVETAPDIVVGYGWGYRGSEESAGGAIGSAVLEDNLNKWSGDHCADYMHVPGVLFSNKIIAAEAPALYDLAPTILAEFGIGTMDWMIGAPVF